MKHKAYPFIRYMFLHGRIGRNELKKYEQAQWVSSGECQKLEKERNHEFC